MWYYSTKKEKSENEEKYSNIKMAAFGIKNVHCVLLVQMENRRGYKVCILHSTIYTIVK